MLANQKADKSELLTKADKKDISGIVTIIDCQNKIFLLQKYYFQNNVKTYISKYLNINKNFFRSIWIAI